MALHARQKVKVVRHPDHSLPALIDGEPMPMNGVLVDQLDGGLWMVRVERIEPLLQFHEDQIETPSIGEVFEMLAQYVTDRGNGSIGLGFHSSPEARWMASVLFGEETPGSEMVGGAAHGIGTLAEAVEQAAGECGLLDD